MNAPSAFPNKLPHLMGTTNSYAKGGKYTEQKEGKKMEKILAPSFKK